MIYCENGACFSGRDFGNGRHWRLAGIPGNSILYEGYPFAEPTIGLEPTTLSLRMKCSTS